MGLFDKVKNLFTEEVEEKVEEKPKEEEIQKEVISVEIPSPTRSEKHIEEVKEEKEPEYKFPFFDDNEFENTYVKPEKKEKRTQKEVYKPLKEEKKTFKPSPIISPVYGILDKGYQKDEGNFKTDNLPSYYSPKEANVDVIRKKAYGNLESDIDTTLFGDKKEQKPIKEEVEEKPRHGESTDDLTDLLTEEMEKTLSEEKKPRKISDKELFSLIDSMYEKENEK